MFKRFIALSLLISLVGTTGDAWARGGGFGGGGGHFGGFGGGGGFDRGGFGGGGFDRGGFGGGGGFDRGGGGFDRGGSWDGAGDRGFAGGDRDFGFNGTQLPARGFGGEGDRGIGSGGFANRDRPLEPGNGSEGGRGDNGVRNWNQGGDKGWDNHNWNNQHNGYGFDRISGNNVWNGGHNNFNYSPTYISNRGVAVRNNFNGWGNFYGHGWWGAHPGGWYCPGWGYGMGMGMSTAWMVTDWAMLGSMLALNVGAGAGYGGNVTYNNNNVYYNNTPVGTSTDYYNSAQKLAMSAGDTTPKKNEWKPLGVFSLVQGDQTDSTTMFQLAINAKGDIAGNYYDMLADQNQQLKGKLDKKSQRCAWTVGSNKNVVYDTGLANLLKDDAPILVHFGKDRTEQFILVRLKRPDGVDPTVPSTSIPVQQSVKPVQPAL